MVKNYSAKHVYQDEQVASSYDDVRFTSRIGKFGDKIEKGTVNKLLRNVSQPNVFLDIPCGTGRFTELLIDNSNFVIGGDISKEMLKMARKKLQHDNLRGLVRCDAEHLPFKDDTFGCVTSIRLMGHIPPLTQMEIEKEMRRVTKKWLIISYANPITLGGIYRKIKSFIKSDEWYQISPKNLSKELGKIGLDTVKIEYFGLHSHNNLKSGFLTKIMASLINIVLRFVAETYVVMIKK